jgi:3-methylfumaryl-CoA hydratase
MKQCISENTERVILVILRLFEWLDFISVDTNALMSHLSHLEPDPSRADVEGVAPPVLREEGCSVATARRVAAMLDLEPDDITAASVLPRGWHFVLLAADARRSALRSDGFPGLGVPMPDLGLPRLMLGGRTVSFLQDIPIGATVMRASAVRTIVRKTTASGSMAVVTLAHELRVAERSEPALVETQTYLLLPPRVADAAAPDAERLAPVQVHTKTIVADETLLFQYCALGFNSHRIHWDRDYARKVEGFPDLVVNGGLATLLLTEFLRRDLGVTPAAISVRHVAPLYCNRPITLAADRAGQRWLVKAFDDRNRVAVDMEVDV